ncbi:MULTISPECIES: hypothetical protein [Mesorhizobium]|uniref:hypothetical protein n=1 Tax=Mesorhizobium TaxID=68287 RepID=UPI000B2E861E|nr:MULTISPECIES: hypothetical protein [Mesorhizobium]MDF3208418.1 hypothetical protein [Mesorhizobium sp. LMG15046]MDF3229011.1 hypothetical protein [Mesorhizobium sp. DSM 30133]
MRVGRRTAIVSLKGSIALAAFFGACFTILLITFGSSARTSAPIEMHTAAD